MTSEVRSTRDIVVFGAVFGVIAILAGIHFLLPDSAHQALIFDHERFRVYTLLTAAYVHAGNNHLFANVVGYLLPSLYVYILCIAVGEQRWFRRTFVVFLTVLPVLVSLSSYAIFSIQFPELSPTSQGFSGVAAGFGGFLLVALAVYVRNQYSKELAQAVGISIFLILMLIVDVVYAGRVRFVVGSLVGIGLLLQLGSYDWQDDIRIKSVDRRQLFVDIAALLFVFVALAYIVVAMFPTDIVSDGRTINIFAHGAGFLLGIITSIIVYWLDNYPLVKYL